MPNIVELKILMSHIGMLKILMYRKVELKISMSPVMCIPIHKGVLFRVGLAMREITFKQSGIWKDRRRKRSGGRFRFYLSIDVYFDIQYKGHHNTPSLDSNEFIFHHF